MMSMNDVLDFLRDNPEEWFEIRDLSEEIGVSETTIACNLRKLEQWEDLHGLEFRVVKKERPVSGGLQEYKREFPIKQVRIIGDNEKDL